MISYEEMSRILMQSLGLKNEPVAITLIKKGQEITDGYVEPETPIRHCQSIMRARKGESLVVPAEKQACTVGASALGLGPTPEKVATGELHYNLGMFETQTAAKRMIDQRPMIEAGSVVATVLSPLSKARVEPDVVVIVGTPEQIYWLMPVAVTFNIGGRVTADTAAFQATCVDATVIPYLTGNTNLSLGCYGCRRSTDIAPEEMLVGIPMSNMRNIVAAISKLSQGPIPKSRGNRNRSVQPERKNETDGRSSDRSAEPQRQ
jgi:uncharacterized protein (DUF169 family)